MQLQVSETTADMVDPATAVWLAEHVRANIPRYFPEAASEAVDVRPVRQEVRRASILYRFAVETKRDHRDVLVKVPRLWSDTRLPSSGDSGEPDRPRLAFALPPEKRLIAEYRSLVAIDEHFRRLGDRRFGAVRVLDLVPASNALIMETVPGTTLRKLLYRAHRGAGAAAVSRLEEAFGNAGAWLRAYQTIEPAQPLEDRHTRRHDYADFVSRVARFLGEQLGDPGYFERVEAAARDAAERCLPDELPLGVGHGDFALRNVIVGTRGLVTVLDTAARFRTPIYADIGYFLVSLRYNGPQVLSMGAAFAADRLAACERAFLDGYFGSDRMPEAPVRLYELQALLDFWSAVALRRSSAADSWARLANSVKLTHVSRLARRRLEDEFLA